MAQFQAISCSAIYVTGSTTSTARILPANVAFTTANHFEAGPIDDVATGVIDKIQQLLVDRNDLRKKHVTEASHVIPFLDHFRHKDIKVQWHPHLHGLQILHLLGLIKRH